MFDAVSAQLGAPVPPPGVPGPFSLEDSARLTAVLSGSGLSSVEVTEVAVTFPDDSFEVWWDRRAALAGALSQMLTSLPGEAVEAIRTRAWDATAAYETANGLELPGVTLVATALRP